MKRAVAWIPETLPWFLEPIVMKADLADAPEAFAATSPLDQVRPDAADELGP